MSTYYESVIGFGRARLVTDPEEAREGLRLLVARHAPEMADDLPDVLPSGLAVIAVDVETITGKANRPAD